MFFKGINCREDAQTFLPYGDLGYEGCTNLDLYRPSINSIMNYANKFNVISCGYCLSAINGSNIGDNYRECMGMDVIKPGTNCVVNSDCSLDSSNGCRVCNLEQNRCENNLDKNFCWKGRIEEGLFGVCDEGFCKIV